MKRLSVRLMALLSLGIAGLASLPASAAMVPASSALLVSDGASAAVEQVQYYVPPPPRQYRRRPATRPYYGPVPYGEPYDPCKRRIQQWNGYRYIVRRVRVC